MHAYQLKALFLSGVSLTCSLWLATLTFYLSYPRNKPDSSQNCQTNLKSALRQGSCFIQWTLANPNSLGPEPIQISEIFGLVKATAATCVIVTTPYLHSVLGSLGSLPLLQVHRTHNTAPKRSFSTLLLHAHLTQNMTFTPKF